jgi:hypothetical protein
MCILHSPTPVWFSTPIKVFTLACLEPSGHGDTVNNGESYQVPHIKGCLFQRCNRITAAEGGLWGPIGYATTKQAHLTTVVFPRFSIIAFTTADCESESLGLYIPEHSQQSPLEVRKDCEPRNRQQSLKMNDPLVLSPVHLSPAKQLTTV